MWKRGAVVHYFAALDISAALTDWFIFYFGIASICFWILHLLGASFSHFLPALILTAPLALGISLLTARRADKAEGGGARGDSSTCRPIVLGTLAAAIGAGSLLALEGWLFTFALMLACALTLIAVQAPPRARVKIAPAEPGSPLLPLLLLAGFAALTAMLAHRPDQDDEFYVSAILRLMGSSDTPIRDLREMKSAYALSSYHAIVAGISKSGIPALQVYYLIIPAMTAFLSVFAYFRLLRELTSVDEALLGTVVIVAILILWGDVHRSPGNFAFVRMFQGKAVFTSVIAPLMLYYAIRMHREQSVLAGTALAAALSAGIGATQTVVLIGPLFLVMAAPLLLPRTWNASVQAFWRFSYAPREFARLLASDVLRVTPVLIPLAITALVLLSVHQRPQALHTNIVSSSVLGYTLGWQARAQLAMAALLVVPLLVRRDLQKPLAAFIMLACAIGFSPPVGRALDHLNSAATWRLTWVIPFVPATALVLCRLSNTATANRALSFTLLCSAIIAYGFLGKTTLSVENGTRLDAPAFKLPNQDAIVLRRSGGVTYPIRDGRVCLSNGACF